MNKESSLALITLLTVVYFNQLVDGSIGQVSDFLNPAADIFAALNIIQRCINSQSQNIALRTLLELRTSV